MSTNNLPSTETVRAPVAYGDTGVKLRSMEDAFRFATAVYKSGLAPTAYRSAEAVLVVMQTGMELGMSPMQAIRNMWPGPDGRPNEYVESSWARVLASGLVESWTAECDGDKATVTIRRKGMAEPIVSVYTMDDAKKAGLVKAGSNWEKYSKRMLLARARGFALKDGFADVLKGLSIAETRDEFYSGAPERAKVVEPTVDPLFEDIALLPDAAIGEADTADTPPLPTQLTMPGGGKVDPSQFGEWGRRWKEAFEIDEDPKELWVVFLPCLVEARVIMDGQQRETAAIDRLEASILGAVEQK